MMIPYKITQWLLVSYADVFMPLDLCFVAFHDEEWGVPVHDKKLFEWLSLSGALAELTWPTILSKRHMFRETFLEFDPSVVSKLSEKKIGATGTVGSSLLSELKLRAIIENSRQICKGLIISFALSGFASSRFSTMLQWMGGSRRKFSISRKSTHNRQKQYFEQRKQQEKTAASETHAHETSIHGRHSKECRSLDILNLLNLSIVSAQGSHGNFDSTMKYEMPKDPATINTSSVPPSYSVKINEAGSPPSSYQGELQCPKVSFCKHDNHDLNAANNSLDLRNAATENQLSVFDMLINDESEMSSERSMVRESHVAFSVEGLGKITTETPVHSPKQEGRISSDDFALPLNISRQLNSSKSSNHVLHDIELDVDAVMQDMDIPLGGNPSQFSMDITDSRGNWKPNLSTFSDHMQLGSHYRNRECSFGDSDMSYNIRRETIWDAEVSYLDDDFLLEREDDVSWKYLPHKIDGNSGDFLDFGNGQMSDNAFEAHHVLWKRDLKTTKLNSLDPSPKRLSSKPGHDFRTSIGVSGRHNPFQRNYDISDVPAQPDWPFYETEDSKDNLSLLSEESCSSSAVKGETINSSGPDRMPRQSSRISSTFARTRMKYDMENIFAEETHCEGRDNNEQPSGKYTRTSVLPKSKATKPASYRVREEIGQSQTWLLEEGCNSVDIDFGFSSSHCASEANSVGSQLWAEDPIGAFPVPKLGLDAKSCFYRPKHNESIHCPPFGCFTSEKFAFCQPFNHTNSYDSPVFSNVEPGSIKRVLSPDLRRQGAPLDLSVAGQHRETSIPDLSIQGRMNGGDKRKLKFRPANCEQLEFEMENCFGNDLLFSKEPIKMDGSNPNNKKHECKEAKDGNIIAKERLGVQTSSSVRIHEKCESKGFDCDVETSLSKQDTTEGTEINGPRLKREKR